MRDAHLGAVAEEIQEKINTSLSLNSGYMADAYKRPLLRDYACIGKRTIRLINDQVLIRLIAPERMSHGLWIPESAKRPDHELYRGVVIACGPGDRDKKGRLQPLDVSPGETVVFYWLGGVVDVTKLFNGKDEYRLVKEEHIRYSEGAA